jgi:hypothetical protein
MSEQKRISMICAVPDMLENSISFQKLVQRHGSEELVCFTCGNPVIISPDALDEFRNYPDRIPELICIDCVSDMDDEEIRELIRFDAMGAAKQTIELLKEELPHLTNEDIERRVVEGFKEELVRRRKKKSR